MSHPVSQSEVGSVHQLDRADPKHLKEFGEKLLAGRFGHLCVGIEPTNDDKHGYPKLLKEIEGAGLVEQVRQIIAPELWATFMGVEVIGNHLSGVTYKRPVADDAPREESRQNLLKNVLHAQLPLFDNILVGPDEAGREAVEPGQVFIPRGDSQYNVTIPTLAVNMEIVFAKGIQATREDWLSYMDTQPRPVH